MDLPARTACWLIAIVAGLRQGGWRRDEHQDTGTAEQRRRKQDTPAVSYVAHSLYGYKKRDGVFRSLNEELCCSVSICLCHVCNKLLTYYLFTYEKFATFDRQTVQDTHVVTI